MGEHRKDEDLKRGYFPEGTSHLDVYFKLGEMHFVWDKAKSDKCFAERGFDFQTAAMVLTMRHASMNRILCTALKRTDFSV